MAVVSLIGVQNLDFKGDDGREIKGIKLHISYPDPHVSGEKVDTKFLRDDFCKDHGFTASLLEGFVGSDVDLIINLNGSISDIQPVSEGD